VPSARGSDEGYRFGRSERGGRPPATRERHPIAAPFAKVALPRQEAAHDPHILEQGLMAAEPNGPELVIGPQAGGLERVTRRLERVPVQPVLDGRRVDGQIED
jgi:hypothetical protein